MRRPPACRFRCDGSRKPGRRRWASAEVHRQGGGPDGPRRGPLAPSGSVPCRAKLKTDIDGGGGAPEAPEVEHAMSGTQMERRQGLFPDLMDGFDVGFPRSPAWRPIIDVHPIPNEVSDEDGRGRCEPNCPGRTPRKKSGPRSRATPSPSAPSTPGARRSRNTRSSATARSGAPSACRPRVRRKTSRRRARTASSPCGCPCNPPEAVSTPHGSGPG